MRYLLLCFALVTLLASALVAQVTPVPSLMNFQGRLAKPDGTPVTDGPHTVQFQLWNDATATNNSTNLMWQVTSSVNVKNGVFGQLLNFGVAANFVNGFTLSSAFTGSVWLQMTVDGATLSPRQQLVSNAFAFKANTANSALTVPDGSITASKFAANVFNPLAWLLGGNSGTSPGSNFVGTTDNKSLAFRTNNIEQMRLETGGNLGLGTTTPSQQLTLYGGNLALQTPDNTKPQSILFQNSAGSYTWNIYRGDVDGFKADLRFAGGLNGSATALPDLMTLTNTGNLGIGTTAPGARLDVAGTIQMTGFRLLTGASANSVLTSDANGNGSWGQIGAASITDGTITSSKLASGTLNSLTWLLGGNSGTSPGSNFLGTTDNKSLAFRTNNTERIRLDTGGNLGLGTTTPSQQLTLYGGNLALQTPDNTQPQSILFQNSSGSYTWNIYRGDVGNNRADLRFAGGLSSNATTLPDLMTLTNSGNLNIGTTTPLAAGTSLPSRYLTLRGVSGAQTFPGSAGIVMEHPSGGYYQMGINSDQTFSIYKGVTEQLHLDTSGAFTVSGKANLNSALSVGGQSTLSGNTGVGGAPSTNSALLVHGKSIFTNDMVVGGDFLPIDNALYVYQGSNSYGLYVYGNQGSNDYGLYVNGKAGGTGFWNVTSDMRFKTNVQTLPNALDTILNLRGVSYDWKREEWKDMHFGEGRQVGFIAQEVEQVLPELISRDKNGYRSLNYTGVVPVLVEAVKTLKKDNDAKEKNIAALQAVNEAQSTEIIAMKMRLDAIEKLLLQRKP